MDELYKEVVQMKFTKKRRHYGSLANHFFEVSFETTSSQTDTSYSTSHL